MNGVEEALDFVRDRLLVAMQALQRGDADYAASQIESAVDRLREVLEELRGS